MAGRTRGLAADAVILAALLAASVSLSLYKEVDVDLGFHVRTGEYVVRTGTVPQTDVFSYTCADHPWPLHYWVPDVAIYAVYARWGVDGLVIAKCAVVALLFAVLYVGMRRLGISWPVALVLVAWALAMSRPRFSIRPLLLSDLFLAVLSVWWMSFRWRGGPALRFLPLLLMVWANVHAGIVYGVILLAGISGMETLKVLLRGSFGIRWNGFPGPALRSFVLLSAAGVGAAALLVWIMNPLSLRGLLLPFEFYRSDFFMSVIAEYGPIRLPRDGLFVGLACVAVVAFILNRRRLDPTEVALVAVFGGLAATAVRIIIVFGIVSVPIIGRNLEEGLAPVWSRLRGKSRPRAAFPGAVAASAALLVLAGFLVRTDRAYHPGLGLDERLFPEEAFRFIERERPEGEIFNSDAWGGPMILRLYPRYRVFIDGRQEVYGEDFWRLEYFRVLAGGEGWEETLAKYGVNLALLRHPDAQYSHRISTLLAASPEWALVYWDDLVSLYARNEAKNERLLEKAYRAVNPEAFDSGALAASGELERALGELERKVAEDPRCARAQLYLGQALLEAGRPEEAERAFRRILDGRLVDGPVGALYGLGEVFYGAGKIDSAAAYDRAAARLTGVDVFARTRRVRALGAQGLLQKAMRERARIPEGKDRTHAALVLVRALIDHGHDAGAAEAAAEASSERPRDPEVPFLLAQVYEDYDRLAEAEGWYREAIARRPSYPDALNNLAWLLATRASRVEEAEALALEARALKPADPWVLDTLGWVRYLAGKVPEAKATLEDAASRLGEAPGPGAEDLFYHLGVVRAATGDPSGARAAFEKALEIAPGHELSRRALEEMPIPRP